VVVDQDAVMGAFSDQAYNLILLAEDEARMLGQASVGPEHVLLALARSGNVEWLLARRKVTAADIHRVIVSRGGLGEELCLGRVPRAAATDAALERAIDAAVERGDGGPSSEHVLLGLRVDPGAMAILRGVGVDDVEALVDEVYPDRGGPIAPGQLASYRAWAKRGRERPRPGPIPPVFERFTSQARAAIIAAQRHASGGVEPADLLRGLMTVQDGVAARVLAPHGVTRPGPEGGGSRPSRHRAGQGRWAVGSSTPLAPSPRTDGDRAKDHRPAREPQLGQLYSDAARRVIAEESLREAFLRGHPRIATGHLLLAILDTNDQAASAILGGQDLNRIRAAVINALPGDET
jgi:hypothetical protein